MTTFPTEQVLDILLNGEDILLRWEKFHELLLPEKRLDIAVIRELLKLKSISSYDLISNILSQWITLNRSTSVDMLVKILKCNDFTNSADKLETFINPAPIQSVSVNNKLLPIDQIVNILIQLPIVQDWERFYTSIVSGKSSRLRKLEDLYQRHIITPYELFSTILKIWMSQTRKENITIEELLKKIRAANFASTAYHLENTLRKKSPHQTIIGRLKKHISFKF